MHFLPGLFAALALAFVFSEGFRKIGLPRVTGEILAGIILGFSPIRSVLFPAETMGEIGEFAEIGILLLFFFVGLNLSMRKLGSQLRQSVSVGLTNSVLPFFIGLLLGYGLGFAPLPSIVLGITFSMTSATVTFDLLEEARLLKTRLGIISIGSEAISEFIDLLFISMLLTIIQVGQASAVTIFVNLAVFVLIIGAFKLFVIPRLLKTFVRSRRALFKGAIIITLLIGALSGLLGLNALIGAFLAGVLVRRVLMEKKEPAVQEKDTLSDAMDVIAFGFFVPVFFVYVGLSMEFSSIGSLLLGFALSLVAIAATTVSSAIGLLIIDRKSFREGILIGLGITPKGDTDIVVASIALASGLIDRGFFSVIVIMAMFTTIIAPVLFRWAAARWLTEGGKVRA